VDIFKNKSCIISFKGFGDERK